MDISSLTGADKPEQAEPKIEYGAQMTAPLFSGEVKLTVGENALTASGLFDAADIPYAELNELTLADHIVTVRADSGDYAFARMGSWAQPFHDALYDAYNKAVIRSLFVSGQPILTATGDISLAEDGVSMECRRIPVHVYENCVVALPPKIGARRIPLCFAGGLDKGDYTLTLKIDAGESCTFARLGYDTAPFADAVEKQIRKLREKAMTAVRELDPTLNAAQASRIAGLMPEGAAASMGQLNGIAPSFTAALEARIAETRAADSYRVFKELCDPAQIWVGISRMENGEWRMENEDDGNGAVQNPNHSQFQPQSGVIWLIAPSPDGQYATVEFAEADTATFVYRTDGDFDGFARRLNRALEAISFRREAIRLSDEELRRPENAACYMAAKRTASLRFIRAGFAGRVIHSGPESWKRKLLALWNTSYTASDTAGRLAGQAPRPKFCGGCGAVLALGEKFCGHCGVRIR